VKVKSESRSGKYRGRSEEEGRVEERREVGGASFAVPTMRVWCFL